MSLLINVKHYTQILAEKCVATCNLADRVLGAERNKIVAWSRGEELDPDLREFLNKQKRELKELAVLIGCQKIDNNLTIPFLQRKLPKVSRGYKALADTTYGVMIPNTIATMVVNTGSYTIKCVNKAIELNKQLTKEV